MATGERTEETLGTTQVARTGETAVTAGAARAKALIEAAYLVAINRPRDLAAAEAEILPMCDDPESADAFRWERIVGREKNKDTGKWEDVWGDGLSIRFAEVAIQALGNITPTSEIIYEDEKTRIVRVSVTDLQKNVIYSKDYSLAKSVERSKLKYGQVAISEYENSSGQKVFVVEATENEMQNKQSRAESLGFRVNGLRLVPALIKAKAWKQINDTLEKNAKVTEEAIEKLVTAFSARDIGATTEEMENLLQHPVAQMTKQEYLRLRGLYRAIKDGETTWKETIEAKVEIKPEPETGTFRKEDVTPGNPQDHTDVKEPLGAPQQETVFPGESAKSADTPPPPSTPEQEHNQFLIRCGWKGKVKMPGSTAQVIADEHLKRWQTDVWQGIPVEMGPEYGLWLNETLYTLLENDERLPRMKE